MQPARVANYCCKEYAMVLIADFDFAVASQQKALNEMYIERFSCALS